MTTQRQIGFWVAFVVLTTLALWLLRDILLPFVAGFALAYLLDPLADRLQRLGVGRLASTIIILVLFILVVVLALVLLVPLVGQQVAAFVARLPSYAARLQALAAEQGGPLIERIGGPEAMAEIQASIGNLVGEGAAWFGGVLRGLWSGGQALLGVVSILVVTPVVAFYLLVDWDRMVRTLDSWLPRQQQDTIRTIAREIDHAIAGFVRGQASVCLILGTFYAVGLVTIGLNFGGLIGMTAGLLSFIPYVAGSHLDPGDARHLRVRPIRGGEHPLAQARRGIRGAAPRLAHVCPSRLRLPVRLRRAPLGCALGRGRRGDRPPCPATLPRKPALPRRCADADP
jgi:predicted PurR-regulated permease PerM